MNAASWGRAVGEASWNRCARPNDPVREYVCVRLASGVCLEAVQLASPPLVTHFFVGGDPLGQMVEEYIPRPRLPWWDWMSIGWGWKRRWHVGFREQQIGQIELTYPIDRTTRLLLNWDHGSSLPIALGSPWFVDESQFVIPPDTLEQQPADLEQFHFLLNIYFRTLFALDFSSG